MEDNLTTQLSKIEKAEFEILEDTIKRSLGSFIAVGKALHTIRNGKLYREGFKTFEGYCNEKWGIGKAYANRLIGGSQVMANLAPVGALCTPCEIQPTAERQTRPLRILEPAQQREVWEKAVRTADGKVCHFRTSVISVSGAFSDETAETASVPSGLGGGRRWPGPWRHHGGQGWFRRTPGRVARLTMRYPLG